MEETVTNNRTRVNISTTAKGLVQFDITCEYDTPELAKENLDKALKGVREVIQHNGLKEVGE